MSHQLIQSSSNAQIKHLAKLIKQRHYRQANQQFVLEGIHLLQTFMEAGWQSERLYIPQHCLNTAEVQTILSLTDERKFIEVNNQIIRKISSLTEADQPTAIFSLREDPPIDLNKDVIALENIQNPGNVGTILRSAVATGINQVVLNKHCADIWSPKVLRAAMGAHAYIQFYEVDNIAAWCMAYPNNTYATLLNPAAKSLYDLSLIQPAAWIFGNEGNGISQETQNAVKEHVIIPMTGPTESLNVAMAASICLFEQQRQRTGKTVI